MKVDASQSKFHEVADLSEFSKPEVKHLKLLLRRLRFLEDQVRRSGGLSSPGGSGGAVFAEMEMEALEWILLEMAYIEEPSETATAVSGN